MPLSGYHIILIPKDSQKTRRFQIGAFTARLIVIGLAVLLPLLAGVLFWGITYQNRAAALERTLNEDKQFSDQRNLLANRLAVLEKVLGRTEEHIHTLESALGGDVGPIKTGIGPIETETNFEDSLHGLPSLISSYELLSKGELSSAIEAKDTLSMQDIRGRMNALDERLLKLHSRIEEVYDFNEDKLKFLDAMPDALPVNGWITSKFGMRLSPYAGYRKMHFGLDIASPIGTPIVAPASGKVVFADFRGGYGRDIIIDHGYGISTMYAHTSQIFVREGMEVKRGDVIAAVGSTGASTGPHVHYEVHVDGIPVDPLNYIE